MLSDQPTTPSVTLTARGITVHAGRTARITATVNDTIYRCRLQLRRSGRTDLTSPYATSTRARLTWTWTVPRRATTLTWQARVNCSVIGVDRPVVAVVVLRVRGSRHGVRHAAVRLPAARNDGPLLRTSGSVDDDDAATTPVAPAAPAGPPAPGGVGNDYYSPGGCEYWADVNRPDVTFGSNGIRAYKWAAWARSHAFPVDATPQAGDVAVWQPWQGEAGADGHVSYVEAVDATGVLVSEIGYDGNPEVTRRYLTPDRLTTAEFIHHKP